MASREKYLMFRIYVKKISTISRKGEENLPLFLFSYLFHIYKTPMSKKATRMPFNQHTWNLLIMIFVSLSIFSKSISHSRKLFLYTVRTCVALQRYKKKIVSFTFLLFKFSSTEYWVDNYSKNIWYFACSFTNILDVNHISKEAKQKVNKHLVQDNVAAAWSGSPL